MAYYLSNFGISDKYHCVLISGDNRRKVALELIEEWGMDGVIFGRKIDYIYTSYNVVEYSRKLFMSLLDKKKKFYYFFDEYDIFDHQYLKEVIHYLKESNVYIVIAFDIDKDTEFYLDVFNPDVFIQTTKKNLSFIDKKILDKIFSNNKYLVYDYLDIDKYKYKYFIYDENNYFFSKKYQCKKKLNIIFPENISKIIFNYIYKI